MKKFLALTISLLAMNSSVDAQEIPMRGIVEGFYGEPWTFEDRIDLLEFCSAHKLNAYIYAPKDDPYHREKWRKSYPKKKLEEIRKLVEKSREENVEFIFAISPGLDLNFEGRKAEKDRAAILKKISTMKELGITRFAIFFDDIQEKNPEGQVEFLNWIQSNLDTPLITVPTEYFRFDMKDYTEKFSKSLDSQILPLYTGDGVVVPELTDEQYRAAEEIYHRKLGIWWNYPVNDYMKEKLALGAIENLPRESEIPAIFFNPMSQWQLSKIALTTGADYALDTENYSAQKSWNRAIDEQFGNLAPMMKIFADHSMHFENNWAKVGAEDGKKFRETSDRLFEKFDDESFQSLEDQIVEIIATSRILRHRLQPEILKECQLQLEQLERIALADQIALDALRAHSRGNKKLAQDLLDELNGWIGIIEREDKSAKISETSTRKFLTRTIDFLKSN